MPLLTLGIKLIKNDDEWLNHPDLPNVYAANMWWRLVCGGDLFLVKCPGLIPF